MPGLPVGMHFSFAESDSGFVSSCLQGSGVSLVAWELLGCPTIMVERNKVLSLPLPPYSFLLLRLKMWVLKLSYLLGHRGLCHTQHCSYLKLGLPEWDTDLYQSSPCLERGLQSHPGLGRPCFLP